MLTNSLTSVPDSFICRAIFNSPFSSITCSPLNKSRRGTAQQSPRPYTDDCCFAFSPAVIVTAVIDRHPNPALCNNSTTGCPTPVASTVK